MRVFYVDEDDSKRNYYVKIDNVNMPDHLKGFKAISATNTTELIQKIKECFDLNRNPNVEIQLWSNANFTGKRLDTLKEITSENEFIWARAVLNKKE